MGDLMLAPCGLDCGACPFFLATRENAQEQLEQLYTVSARLYPAIAQAAVEDMRCTSCAGKQRSFLCRNCAIRDCVNERHYAGCHVCEEYPCEIVAMVPNPTRRKAIMQAVQNRQDLIADTSPRLDPNRS